MSTVVTQVRLALLGMALVLAAVAAAHAAAAPRLLCYPILPGETVTSISVRLTRDPQSWRGAGFQILDPAAARFVAKNDYEQLHPGWQACIVEQAPVHEAVGRHGWWLLVLLSLATSVGLFVVQWTIDRKKTSLVMETFGAAFIREFERPLVDPRSSRSVLHAELALSPEKGSLEVRIAPTGGRRYPNLSDHRTNVEYDVERVVTLLNDRRFICGPLHARGPWVAIPFHMAGRVRSRHSSSESRERRRTAGP